MKSPRFAAVKFKPEDLTWLFPSEIITKLETLARDCGISLDTSTGGALPTNQALDALDSVVNGFILPALYAKQPLSQKYVLLPADLQRHLVHLMRSSRAAARTLQTTQPDTPLGFPKGPQGVLSNLLSASWIDLTEGGKVPVRFEPIP